MNKKQGSAMVMAILLLSFFMALSLNMWYISQKKAQRAGDIVVGNRVLTDIDSSSTLGYYEFYLATEYMTNGFVTSPSAYTLPSSTTEYAISTTAGTIFNTTIEGIRLENERQYFGAYLYTSGSALSGNANALLKKEVISSGKLQSRDWETTNVTGAAIKELWEATPSTKSIGGYEIISINGNPYSSPYTLLPSTDILIVYEKEIYFNSNNKNKPISYKIRVERKVKTDSSSPSGIESDGINNITVTLQ